MRYAHLAPDYANNAIQFKPKILGNVERKWKALFIFYLKSNNINKKMVEAGGVEPPSDNSSIMSLHL